jgi:valyl-tRNA synthetase
MAGSEGTAGGAFDALRDAGRLRPYHLDLAAKLDELAADLDRAFGEYRFNEVAQRLYEFLWSEFCDKFLEAVKGDLRDTAAPGARQTTLAVFDAVMSRYLQLLHPYMPHITEELSQRMGYLAAGEFLMQRQLPPQRMLADRAADSALAARAAAVYETAGRLRNLKAEYNVATRRDVKFVVKPAVEWLAAEADVLALLTGAGEIALDPGYQAPQGTPAALTPVGECYLPLEGLIDLEAERTRLDKEIDKTDKEVSRCEAKLGKPSFVDRAPEAVVAQERERLAEWQAKLAQLREIRAALG